MLETDLLREIREVREKFARDHGYDLHAMFATLRAMELACGRTVVTLAPHRPKSYLTPVASDDAVKPDYIVQRGDVT